MKHFAKKISNKKTKTLMKAATNLDRTRYTDSKGKIYYITTCVGKEDNICFGVAAINSKTGEKTTMLNGTISNKPDIINKKFNEYAN